MWVHFQSEEPSEPAHQYQQAQSIAHKATSRTHTNTAHNRIYKHIERRKGISVHIYAYKQGCTHGRYKAIAQGMTKRATTGAKGLYMSRYIRARSPEKLSSGIEPQKAPATAKKEGKKPPFFTTLRKSPHKWLQHPSQSSPLRRYARR